MGEWFVSTSRTSFPSACRSKAEFNCEVRLTNFVTRDSTAKDTSISVHLDATKATAEVSLYFSDVDNFADRVFAVLSIFIARSSKALSEGAGAFDVLSGIGVVTTAQLWTPPIIRP